MKYARCSTGTPATNIIKETIQVATVGFVSLGCDKNRINCEQMLWRLADAGHELLDTPELAQVVIINTCAFIEAAKSEAIENILEIAAAKKENRSEDGMGGNVEKIIVTGCLAERYREDIFDELPEVDGLVGCGSFDDIVAAVDDALAGIRAVRFGDINAPVSECSRVIVGEPYSVNIKLSEGCSNNCAYCVIPSIRGRYRSRTFENVVAEARGLAELGAKELILVAQDLTRFGTDTVGCAQLPDLLDALQKIEGIRWIRLHYLYPEGVTPELIDAIKRNDKVLRCLDIPIQHINDGILRSMRRRSTGEEIRSLFRKLREELPGVVIRTSIIIGLPGEGEQEFEELCGFLREFRLERAGFFAYSPEEGTDAAEMPNRPDEETVHRRIEIVEDIQREIMDARNDELVGKIVSAIYEGTDEIIKYSYGRTYADAPDIDGKVFFKHQNPLEPGDIVDVLIDESADGNLFGRAFGRTEDRA